MGLLSGFVGLEEPGLFSWYLAALPRFTLSLYLYLILSEGLWLK